VLQIPTKSTIRSVDLSVRGAATTSHHPLEQGDTPLWYDNDTKSGVTVPDDDYDQQEELSSPQQNKYRCVSNANNINNSFGQSIGSWSCNDITPSSQHRKEWQQIVPSIYRSIGPWNCNDIAS
jgi:hypothetical protein